MKKVLRLIAAVATVAFMYSCEDPVDTDSIDVSSVPPRLASSTPSNNVLTKIETAFDVKGFWTDGPLSPLVSGSIQLLDSNNVVVGEISETLTGTSDSIVWAAADNGSAALTKGRYRLVFTATDDANGTVRDTTSFRIFASLYNANHAGIFIAGNFNGWAGDQASSGFDLIANNTWERKGVTLDGGGWKLRNTTDWSDVDWGDNDCDGVMNVTSGGGPNTECWAAGTYDIKFNDATLTYTMVNQNPPAQRIDDLFLVGAFNDFTGNDDYNFNLDSSNHWSLEVILEPGDAFKFSEAADLRQRIWGDNENDGVADLYGATIKLANDAQEGYYIISFVDNTFNYTIEFDRGLYPENLYLVGGSSGAGWDNGAAVRFEKRGDGIFRTYQYLDVAGGGFKFLPMRGSWDGDYGQAKGAAAGTITQDDEDNVTVSADGFYRIDVNFVTGTFTVAASNWGIIGDATPGGWADDTNMTGTTTKGQYTWTITGTFTDGQFKVRENDSWDINYGLGSAAGSLGFNSSNNIPITAGTRTVTITLNSEAGYTYTIN
jgi:hypothetical protein